MDLSKLEKVEKVRSLTFHKMQDYDLLYNPKTEKFRFSEEVFENLGLTFNSLTQFIYDQENEKHVFLQITPGNNGVFMKKTEGKKKGREFKNQALFDALKDILDKNPAKYKYFTLNYVSEFNDLPLWEVVLDTERYERLVAAKDNTETKTNNSDTEVSDYLKGVGADFE